MLEGMLQRHNLCCLARKALKSMNNGDIRSDHQYSTLQVQGVKTLADVHITILSRKVTWKV